MRTLDCGAPQLRVVAQTSGILFVDKPPGLGFHTEGDQLGVMPLLRAMQQDGEIAHDGRLFAVHRLDRVTSGLLMVAKTPAAAQELSLLLRERRLHKYYVALSARKPKKKQGKVQGDMARSRRGQWMLTRSASAPAITHFLSQPLLDHHAFLLSPRTGKTHQLRVALKSLGSPILGDQMYAEATAARREERAYLHAAALRLPATPALVSDEDLLRADCRRGGMFGVVCRPSEGAEFTATQFVSLFRSWFPSDQPPAVDEPWFAGTAVATAPPHEVSLRHASLRLSE